MALATPATILAGTFDKYSHPMDYDLVTLPAPQINNGDEILIKVYAALVKPATSRRFLYIFDHSSTKMHIKCPNQLSSSQLIIHSTFPYRAGEEVSGAIVSVGSAVQDFKVGDGVFASLPTTHRGSCAEYATVSMHCVTRKPSAISHIEAASISIAAQIAFQYLSKHMKPCRAVSLVR